MNCSDSHEEISSYYDAQLSEQRHGEFAQHARQCESCCADLEAFAALSQLVADSKSPAPPAGIWNAIEDELNAKRSADPVKPTGSYKHRQLPRWALIAASILMTVGVAGVGIIAWQRAHTARQVVDLSDYLNIFEQNPDKALQLLVAKYDGKPFMLATEKHGGVTAKVVQQLPADYSVTESHVLTMPGCKCVHCTCHAADGQTLAVFEHDKSQAVTFGKRPVIQTRCDGTNCTIVQVGDRLAVSWQQDNQSITVVGARNLNEVQQLIARMNPKAHHRNRSRRRGG